VPAATPREEKGAEPDACLRDGRDDLPSRFYRRVSKVIDTPWRLAANADLAYEGVAGRGALGTCGVNRYAGLVQRAATRDPLVCRALIMVTGLLAPPSTLLQPGIVGRAFRHVLVRRKDEGPPLPPQPAPEAVRTT
jgi:hypothetical protein